MTVGTDMDMLQKHKTIMHTNKNLKRKARSAKLLLFGMAILIMPFFVFANGDDIHIDDISRVHEEVVEIDSIQTQEDEHFVGDTHTDHAHELTIRGPWWQDKTWWQYLIISLLLMSILSFGVYKYLEDK